MQSRDGINSHDPNFNGKRSIVMGLGRFGGGIGVARWLCHEGARVLVTDSATEGDLRGSMDALRGLDIEYRLGGHEPADLERCDLLVVSPAVDKAHSPFVQQAVRAGIPVTSEMNLFLQRCPAKRVGITGTVGKSTTTAMLGSVLELAATTGPWRHGRVWLGGNIGKSLLDDLPAMKPEDVVVLELSSFQLKDAASIRRNLNYALITNIRENHLDRHGTMLAYAEAKAQIYRHQRPGDVLALPLTGATEWLPDDWRERRPLCRYGIEPPNRTITIETITTDGRRTERFDGVELTVPGLHNLQNAAAALCLARMLSVPDRLALDALRRFRGLAHRLEFIRDFEGVAYYNDSKSTTPGAAITALEAFDRPVVMIVGGSDKGLSFAALGNALAAKAKAVICIGATSAKIAAEVLRAAGQSSAGIEETADLASGLLAAKGRAAKGNVVVLSPGCASYDQFKNYEQRGETFRHIVCSW